MSKKVNYYDVYACFSFILLGLFVIYQSYSFTMLGAVFPRYVAYVMVACSALYILISFVFGNEIKEKLPKIGSRRVAIYLVILFWAISIKYFGFLLPSLFFYFLAIFISNHEVLSNNRKSAYLSIGAAFVLFMYFIFTKILNVPLP